MRAAAGAADLTNAASAVSSLVAIFATDLVACYDDNAMGLRERTLVAIPPKLAAKIDRLAGPRRRTEFITEVLEDEILRREQLMALELAAGSWKDEDHPELAAGSVPYVEMLRRADDERFQRLVASQD